MLRAHHNKAPPSIHIRGNTGLLAHGLLTHRASSTNLHAEHTMVVQMLATPAATPETSTDLRVRMLRIRRLASALVDEEARRQLLAMAEELESRAASLEDAGEAFR